MDQQTVALAKLPDLSGNGSKHPKRAKKTG
jgi:hypothetical protein